MCAGPSSFLLHAWSHSKKILINLPCHILSPESISQKNWIQILIRIRLNILKLKEFPETLHTDPKLVFIWAGPFPLVPSGPFRPRATPCQRPPLPSSSSLFPFPRRHRRHPPPATTSAATRPAAFPRTMRSTTGYIPHPTFHPFHQLNHPIPVCRRPVVDAGGWGWSYCASVPS